MVSFPPCHVLFFSALLVSASNFRFWILRAHHLAICSEHGSETDWDVSANPCGLFTVSGFQNLSIAVPFGGHVLIMTQYHPFSLLVWTRSQKLWSGQFTGNMIPERRDGHKTWLSGLLSPPVERGLGVHPSVERGLKTALWCQQHNSTYVQSPTSILTPEVWFLLVCLCILLFWLYNNDPIWLQCMTEQCGPFFSIIIAIMWSLLKILSWC